MFKYREGFSIYDYMVGYRYQGVIKEIINLIISIIMGIFPMAVGDLPEKHF